MESKEGRRRWGEEEKKIPMALGTIKDVHLIVMYLMTSKTNEGLSNKLKCNLLPNTS